MAVRGRFGCAVLPPLGLPDASWRKPCQPLPPPVLTGPLSDLPIPVLAGVRSLQPRGFTYSNWLHNNSFKGKPLRGSP